MNEMRNPVGGVSGTTVWACMGLHTVVSGSRGSCRRRRRRCLAVASCEEFVPLWTSLLPAWFGPSGCDRRPRAPPRSPVLEQQQEYYVAHSFSLAASPSSATAKQRRLGHPPASILLGYLQRRRPGLLLKTLRGY